MKSFYTTFVILLFCLIAGTPLWGQNLRADFSYQPISSTFTEVGRMPAAGNSTTSRDYQLIDEKPLAGINTYRMLQVDINGNMHILNQGVEVNFQTGETDFQVVQVYPNPFKGKTQMRLFFAEEKIQAGICVISVDLGEWKSGLYVYHLRFNGQEVTGRMMKM